MNSITVPAFRYMQSGKKIKLDALSKINLHDYILKIGGF